jgi:hypothetical protein
MKTLLSLIVYVSVLSVMQPVNLKGQSAGAEALFPRESAFNLINDGSFEEGWVPNNYQGNLPDTWFHVTNITPGADTYSSDPALKHGILPGSYGHWEAGTTGSDGIRFVAGCDFASANVEGFGNEIIVPTVAGNAYSLSGFFRFSNALIWRGVYDIYLAVDELTLGEVSDPDKAVYIGSLGRNSNYDDWSYDALQFVAPDVYSHVIMLPRTMASGATYPGCDDWQLIDLGPASLHADTFEMRVGTGGTVNFSLDAGPSHADRHYFLLGSLTGIEPGTPLPGGMATLPLNWDFFTDFVALMANAPFFSNFQGTLDGAGMGAAQFNTSGPLPLDLKYYQMSFAFLLYAPFDFASNAVALEIKP